MRALLLEWLGYITTAGAGVILAVMYKPALAAYACIFFMALLIHFMLAIIKQAFPAKPPAPAKAINSTETRLPGVNIIGPGNPKEGIKP